MNIYAAKAVLARRCGIRTLSFLVAATALAAGYPLLANAQPPWIVNGVWVNNMCRAPSGAWWLYPPQNAQPVGSACAIPSTGESGVVAAN
jgi:hypothetical protein